MKIATVHDVVISQDCARKRDKEFAKRKPRRSKSKGVDSPRSCRIENSTEDLGRVARYVPARLDGSEPLLERGYDYDSFEITLFNRNAHATYATSV